MNEDTSFNQGQIATKDDERVVPPGAEFHPGKKRRVNGDSSSSESKLSPSNNQFESSKSLESKLSPKKKQPLKPDMTELLDTVSRKWTEGSKNSVTVKHEPPEETPLANSSAQEQEDSSSEDSKKRHRSKVEEASIKQDEKQDEAGVSLLYTDNIAAACAATNELASGLTPTNYQEVFQREAKRQRSTSSRKQDNVILIQELRQDNADLNQKNLSLQQQMDALKQDVVNLVRNMLPQQQQAPAQQQHEQQQLLQQQQQHQQGFFADLLNGNQSSSGGTGEAIGGVPANVTSLLARRYQQQQQRAAQGSSAIGTTSATGSSSTVHMTAAGAGAVTNPLLSQLLVASRRDSATDHIQRFLASTSNPASPYSNTAFPKTDSSNRFGGGGGGKLP